MAERGYLGKDVPLLKHVAATAGQRVCRIGVAVSVDGRPVAVALTRDRIDRPLPVWQGCRTLAAGEVLLLNPDSCRTERRREGTGLAGPSRR